MASHVSQCMAKACMCVTHGKPCVNMHGSFEAYIRGGREKEKGRKGEEKGRKGKEKGKKKREEEREGREEKERGKGRSVAQ